MKPKATKKRKDTQLMIRLTSQQKDAINEAASVSGLSMSSWALERLLAAIKKETENV